MAEAGYRLSKCMVANRARLGKRLPGRALYVYGSWGLDIMAWGVITGTGVKRIPDAATLHISASARDVADMLEYLVDRHCLVLADTSGVGYASFTLRGNDWKREMVLLEDRVWSREDIEKLPKLGELLRFRFFPLGNTRCRVELRCIDINAIDNFLAMLSEVAKCWPETAGEVAAYVDSLNEVLALATVDTAEDTTEDQPSKPTRADKAAVEPATLIADRETMKRYYRDYNPDTAAIITGALPKAWEAYTDRGGQWGPTVIAQACRATIATISRETVGRYLKAFVCAGITEINGIGIPYHPRAH